MRRSSYTIVKVTPEKVFLVDNNLGGLSVTNDAEAVVAEVWKLHPGRRIIYQDSDGDWAELCHFKGTFSGFGLYRDELPEGY
jgi:hypothetical protein